MRPPNSMIQKQKPKTFFFIICCNKMQNRICKCDCRQKQENIKTKLSPILINTRKFYCIVQHKNQNKNMYLNLQRWIANTSNYYTLTPFISFCLSLRHFFGNQQQNDHVFWENCIQAEIQQINVCSWRKDFLISSFCH